MRRFVTRSAVISTALICAAGVWASASAQLGISRSDQIVLVLWPLPGPNNLADTTLAIGIGDQLREKLDVKERFKMRVPTRAKICEILAGSGFHCPELLDGENAERLASAMGVQAYVVGVLTRNSKPTLHIRLVDLKRTGLSGWITVVGDTNWKAEQFGAAAVDSIDSALRGAEAAHDCYDKLDHNDVKGAREKVAEAFKLYPTQPAAALCLVRYFEVSRAPVDSIIFALDRATRGDSLNPKPWDRLANAYLEKNNTAKAVDARDHQLTANPRNAALRKSVAAGWIELAGQSRADTALMRKNYQRGLEVLDVGLQDNPLDADLLNIKQRACLDAQMWKCALSALSSYFEADSVLKTDSVFYAKIFGAAQSVNDTAAMLKWSGLAVKNVPNSLTMWRARAAALSTAGKTDSAVVAYQHVLTYDSTNVGVILIVARSMVDGLTIDSTAPVDTAKLSAIDAYLSRAARLAKDSVTTQGTIGSLYAIPGLMMATKKKPAAVYVPWLEKAVSFPLPTKTQQQANFFLGLYYFNQAIAVDPEIQRMGHPQPARALTAAENARACELVRQEEEAAGNAKRTMTIGAPTFASAGNQVLGGANQFLTKNIPAYKKFFKCK